MREQLADLLDAIANDEGFDSAKYNEFQAILATVPRDPVIVEAANTLIEYGNCMTSRSLVLRKKLRPDRAQERQLREDLQIFARAIRAGIKEYGSMKKLRSNIASQN